LSTPNQDWVLGKLLLDSVHIQWPLPSRGYAADLPLDSRVEQCRSKRNSL
jgi:hypothetical protein